MTFWTWWKKYGEHLTAPLILIALILLGYMFYLDIQTKKEISVNCGWGDDNYKCFCEKGKAMEIKNKIDEIISGESGDLNASLVG